MRHDSLRAYWFERPRLILLPFLAGALALFLWARPLPDPRPFVQGRVVSVQGALKDGSEFVCQRQLRRGLIEFCIVNRP